MKSERRNQILLMVFLGLVLGLAIVVTLHRTTSAKTADPGFADYSLHAETDAPAALEVDAVREAETINAGNFRPFIVGESSDR